VDRKHIQGRLQNGGGVLFLNSGAGLGHAGAGLSGV
jgi:hypothetical protein